MAIGGTGEIAGRADEGARDHAADFVRAAQNVPGGFADFVELPERDHLFVGGHLENAVRGSVDDRRAGSHVLAAELPDDFGAGGRFVTERAAADATLEFVHDLGWEALGVEGKGTIEMDSGHFPVAGCGVLAG